MLWVFGVFEFDNAFDLVVELNQRVELDFFHVRKG
jgi:hypothetical protein